MDLISHKDYRADELSSGLKKRLGIGLTLVREADVYLLDEPFNGLDAESVQTVQNAIAFISDRQKILLVASHVFYAVEPVCTKVIVLGGGGVRGVGWGIGNGQYFQTLSARISGGSIFTELYWLE
jgi:ABC-type multidrug transport system ATPase subunit